MAMPMPWSLTLLRRTLRSSIRNARRLLIAMGCDAPIAVIGSASDVIAIRPKAGHPLTWDRLNVPEESEVAVRT